MALRPADLYLPVRLAGALPPWATKMGCAILGVGVAVCLRLLVQLIAPGAAPFAFIYPTSLFVTLIGGAEAGLGTLLISGFIVWKFAVPLGLSNGHVIQSASAILVAVTGLMVIAIGEAFRIGAQRALADGNAKLAERELLFRELRHRVSNDFAIVTSLLDLQRRRSNDAETRVSLEQAMARIRSIARVHQHVYSLSNASAVDMRGYIADLCAALRDAVLPAAGVTLSYSCESCVMQRDRALAVGLVTNELVTNAVKHAFPHGRDGHIRVEFTRLEKGWRLSVADDGIGTPAAGGKLGLGSGLIQEFVKQANGVLSHEVSSGTIARLDLPDPSPEDRATVKGSA